jgi:hypothetical protein
MHPRDTSFVEIAETAYGVYNLGGKVTFLKEQKDIPDNIFEQNLSLYNAINQFPKIDLETGIRRIKNFRGKI